MNTHLAGPIVTGGQALSAPGHWPVTLLIAGLSLIAISAFVVIRAAELDGLGGRLMNPLAVSLVVAGFFAMTMSFVVVVAERAINHSELHREVLIAEIEDAYKVEAITYTGSGGTPVLGTSARVPDAESLCQEATTSSPEYTGVAHGQQISFKVGVPNCRSESPDVEIIITKTPGIPLTADQLRK